MQKKSFSIFFLACLFMLTTAMMAQNRTETIPTDPNVKVGTLENGLTYYIRNNERPEDIVELRLVVNAGSILEDEDQLGLAHFMEHMNFNGTKNFKKNHLVDYLQTIGVKFGADLNAYTSFDRTVYILPIPTEDQEILDKGFQILEDWAHNATLKHQNIDDERGVVLEEYRIGLGASKRMRQEYFPKILKNTRFAKRLPIGTEENLKNFDYESLKRFYADWYRPGLMAVIAIGDLEPSTMLQKIKDHFGAIPAQKNPRKRAYYSIPNHEETYIAIATDKEAGFTRVQLVYQDKGKKETMKTVNDYRDHLINRLFSQMINNRLDELRNSPNPPFVFGASYHGRYWSPQKEAFRSFAMTSKGGQLKALKTLLISNKQVKKYGFDPLELERAKKDLLSSLKDNYKGRKTMESSRYVNQYISNFLQQEPIPGITWEYETAQQLVPEIGLEEVSHLIDKYLHKDNRTILLTGPEYTESEKITEQDIRDLLQEVTEKEVEPYKVEVVRKNLMMKMPEKGSIVNTKTNAELGTTILTLNNGAEVIYKKTDFKENQILFKAFSYGGSSLYKNDVYKKTAYANGGLNDAGVAGLSKTDLDKVLAGKNVSVSPYIGGLTEGFRGNATPEDLETLFQLVHLYFTSLNKDEEAYQSFISKQKAFLGPLLAKPTIYFNNELNEYIHGDSPRYMGFPTPELLDKADYDLAYDKYIERFANAGDFKFYFVGDIPVEDFKNYVEKYLASLPSSSENEKYNTFSFRPKNEEHTEIIKKGTAPKSTVRIIYQGETAYDSKEDYYMKSLGDILSIKLVESLREKTSGVYGVGARGGLSKIPYGSYSFRISFPSGPENVKKLIGLAEEEVQKIIKNGPTSIDLTKIKETQLLSYKEDMKENKFWLNQLISSEKNKTDKTAFLNFKQKVKDLSKKDIQKVAKKYLSDGPVIGILYPAGYEPPN